MSVQQLYQAMEQANPSKRVEQMNNPVTLESVVNGARVTVQRNSIAHAELAKGENGMLVRAVSTASRGVSPGVAFNEDGVIVGREHLVGGGSTATKVISPALNATIKKRDEENKAKDKAVTSFNPAP